MKIVADEEAGDEDGALQVKKRGGSGGIDNSRLCEIRMTVVDMK